MNCVSGGGAGLFAQGSEHNMTPTFARTVTADCYVFFANGEHGNPDLDVVR